MTMLPTPNQTPAGGKAGGKPAGGGQPMLPPSGPLQKPNFPGGGPMPKPGSIGGTAPIGPGGTATVGPGGTATVGPRVGGKMGGGMPGMPGLPQPAPTLSDTLNRRGPLGAPISGIQPPPQPLQPKQAANKPVGS